jgi:hypothetical protein
MVRAGSWVAGVGCCGRARPCTQHTRGCKEELVAAACPPVELLRALWVAGGGAHLTADEHCVLAGALLAVVGVDEGHAQGGVLVQQHVHAPRQPAPLGAAAVPVDGVHLRVCMGGWGWGAFAAGGTGAAKGQVVRTPQRRWATPSRSGSRPHTCSPHPEPNAGMHHCCSPPPQTDTHLAGHHVGELGAAHVVHQAQVLDVAHARRLGALQVGQQAQRPLVRHHAPAGPGHAEAASGQREGAPRRRRWARQAVCRQGMRKVESPMKGRALGRLRLAPRGAAHPCQTSAAAAPDRPRQQLAAVGGPQLQLHLYVVQRPAHVEVGVRHVAARRSAQLRQMIRLRGGDGQPRTAVRARYSRAKEPAARQPPPPPHTHTHRGSSPPSCGFSRSSRLSQSAG